MCLFGLSVITACLSDKGEEDLLEGETPGDCDDGEDNDGNGVSDCEDDGCLNVSPCSYTGGYEIDRCNNYEPTGYAIGDVSEDFDLPDQHGEMVTLSDFCNKLVILDASSFT